MFSIKYKPIGHWGTSCLLLFVISLGIRFFFMFAFPIEINHDGFVLSKEVEHLALTGSHLSGVPKYILPTLLLLTLRVLFPVSIDTFIIGGVLSAVTSSLAVVIIYLIGRDMFDRLSGVIGAAFLSVSPHFLLESSSTSSAPIFCLLYVLTLWLTFRHRYRLASVCAALSMLSRYEGLTLFVFVFIALAFQSRQTANPLPRSIFSFHAGMFGCSVAIIVMCSYLITGNPLAFLDEQSFPALQLSVFWPGNFVYHMYIFFRFDMALTPIIAFLGLIGMIERVLNSRGQNECLLIVMFVIFTFFYAGLLFLNKVNIEWRYLTYPGVVLYIFGGYLLSSWIGRMTSQSEPSAHPLHDGKMWALRFPAIAIIVIIPLLISFRQGYQDCNRLYEHLVAQDEVADHLARVSARNKKIRVVVYASDVDTFMPYARQKGLVLDYLGWEYLPEDSPETFVLENDFDYLIYPVHNGWARARFPYLSIASGQIDRNGVKFVAVDQFTTQVGGLEYIIWSVSPSEEPIQ